MKYLFLFLILAITPMAAQTTTEAIQKEIDQTVWKPFQKAFETLDGNALNATYADQVLRVTPQGIDTKNAFKKGNIDRFVANRKNGDKISLDFWFDNRKTNETTSYEVGFYRIGFTSKGGKIQYSYGQFHIVLEKINGQWKITQDWDTATIAGKPITANEFDKKEALKF